MADAFGWGCVRDGSYFPLAAGAKTIMDQFSVSSHPGRHPPLYASVQKSPIFCGFQPHKCITTGKLTVHGWVWISASVLPKAIPQALYIRPWYHPRGIERWLRLLPKRRSPRR